MAYFLPVIFSFQFYLTFLVSINMFQLLVIIMITCNVIWHVLDDYQIML